MSLTQLWPHPSASVLMPPKEAPHGSPAQARDLCQAAFGIPFAILNGSTGELLLHAPDQPARGWELRGTLAQEVSRRGKPELIEEGGPLVTLAIPLVTSRTSDYVAVGALLTRPLSSSPADLREASELLGLELEETRTWISRQRPCPVEVIARLAELVHDKHFAQLHVDRLETENALLVERLATSCDEVSLLYCLIQNLRVTADDDQLARMALEWLGNVVPSQGLVLSWNNGAAPAGPLAAPRSGESFFTRGQIPLDHAGLREMLGLCGQVLGAGPILVNQTAALSPDWAYPAVRSLLAVPLGGAGEPRGWLAALNTLRPDGFSQVEVNLFQSVATILGIHRENTDLFRDQSELVAGVVHALTSAIDAKDSFTSGHSDRVARISVRLGQQLGCSPTDLKTLYLAGLLHDVGKIGIDDDVLRKTSELDADEFEQIKHHPRIGYQILADLKKFQHVLPVVLHHHEAWDGSGYPDGLRGKQIPRLARIVAVADAFDAMASRRPYRPGLPMQQLDQVFRENSGTQWDPDVVRAFFEIEAELISILKQTPQPGVVEAPDWT